MKRLIVTADDFGLSTEVNQAVVEAHQNGILTCASLMVGGKAADEAVVLARKHPLLKVGLHLTLVNGFSILAKEEIPDLVDENGRFSDDNVLSGIRYFFSRRARTQIAMECEAQIRKFLDTGLSMDHINSHRHLHIHPVIRDIILRLVFKYRIPAIRLPRPVGRAPNLQSTIMTAIMAPWVLALQRRLAATGIPHNREIFGLHETGALVEAAWLRIIPRIRDGITEIYCHPAYGKPASLDQKTQHYKNEEELAALISPSIREQLDRLNVVRTDFTALKE